MEPSRLTVCAIVSLRRAAHSETLAGPRKWRGKTGYDDTSRRTDASLRALDRDAVASAGRSISGRHQRLRTVGRKCMGRVCDGPTLRLADRIRVSAQAAV